MRAEPYAEFSRIVHGEVVRSATPIDGTIEVTHRCPLACVHCCNNLPLADAPARRREMTLEEHRRIVDEIAEAGCLWLLYTGGEIFVRPDFPDIYRRAKEAGLLVTLFTNGVLVDERIADVLAEWRPFVVEITLYGAARATYERLTGRPGTYDRCRRAIELLLERRVPLKLKTVAVTVNRTEVFEMARLAESLGLEFKFDAMICPRIDRSHAPLAARLSPAEVVALDLRDPVRVLEWRRLGASCGPGVPTQTATPTLYGCGGGLHSFAIDPYGRLAICTLSTAESWDLRKGSFREGWETFLRGVRARPARRVTKCAFCSLQAMCGMCPANGEIENGDPEAPVEFLCETAHLRAEVFGVPVRPHGRCDYCGSRREEILRAAGELRT